jgi:hypothetical protein
MKESDFDQLYQKMTSVEKATLMFNATMNDSKTCSRIINNVPRYTYEMRDSEFSRTLFGITAVPLTG